MSGGDKRAMSRRLLVLGGGQGWHGDQLQAAASDRGHEICFATYESLSARIESNRSIQCDAGPVNSFDAVLTRTMPAGSMETILFRLACLHDLVRQGMPIINPPASLELAIDKFATLAIAAQIGCKVPETCVVQDRDAAMSAFDQLGGDCVVKPLFGGEGRGVMRIEQRELAWTVFSTLHTVSAVLYVQRFVPPGGRDRRVLIIGDEAYGIRRTNRDDFRTNTHGRSATANNQTAESFIPSGKLLEQSRQLAEALGLSIAAVDWIDDENEQPVLVEANAIPGWKTAQSVIDINLAERMIDLLESKS
jgi:RimK family alpha-L-glutamate ligase